MEQPCGLLTVTRTPVPLKSISVKVEVKGFVASVSASLEYSNEDPDPLEAVFVFPMDSDSAVYNFQATVDGKTIVAKIKEKEQAKNDYDDAISSGHQAFLLHEDNSSSDIFTCSVGNLPPGQKATVSFSLVQELPLEADGAVRFTLPAVLNPRYTPTGTEAPKITVSDPVDKPSYTLGLEAHFHSPLGISRVQSNCQVTPLEFLSPDKTAAKLSLVDGHGFDRDVELLIYSDNIHEPSAIFEAGVESAAPGTLMADPTIMLNLFPNFPESPSKAGVGEFIFLMDRSGSMDCRMFEGNAKSRIECAKDTLLLLLKSLPMGCYFNIYGFGSNFKSFFPKSVEYNQSSMQEALAKLQHISANMGGTEILQPLTAIYRTPCLPGHPRQLFVFTDGEVSNIRQVLDEVQRHAPNHRCFSFGIGEGASTALIKGMAKAASGNYEFITGKERMQPKVLRTLTYALQPSGTGLTLSWDLPPGLEAVPLSQLQTVLFNGHRTIVYAQLKGKIDPTLECGATLKYSLGEQQMQAVTRFSLNPKSDSLAIHHLAAKAMIGALELGPDHDSQEVKSRLVEISIQAGVVSSQTAFVAINKDLNKPLQGPLRHRAIPLIGGFCQQSRQFCMSMACSMPGGYQFQGSSQNANYALQAICPMDSDELDDDSDTMEESHSRTLEALTDYSVDAEDHSSLRRNKRHITMNQKCVSMGDMFIDDRSEEDRPAEPPMLMVITLQNADGSWGPDMGLESLLGLNPDQVRHNLPQQDVDLSVWLTVLAVIWLHSFAADTKDEWGLLVDKSLAWLKANTGADLVECVKVGNSLLKASVLPETLGL